MPDLQPVLLELPAEHPLHARYWIRADGTLEPDITAEPHPPRHTCTVTARPTADTNAPVATYTARDARTAASNLVNISARLREIAHDTPAPGAVTITPASPDSEARHTSWWVLPIPGAGQRANFAAPFTGHLHLPPGPHQITADQAEQWAAALLGLACGLEHANAVATHTVRAGRAGEHELDILYHSICSELDSLPATGTPARTRPEYSTRSTTSKPFATKPSRKQHSAASTTTCETSSTPPPATPPRSTTAPWRGFCTNSDSDTQSPPSRSQPIPRLSPDTCHRAPY